MTATKKTAEQYTIDLIKYLKQHGKTQMAALAGKVKKPQSIPMKFKDFITMKTDDFKVTGEFVDLK